ncbi:MAG: hypothetical protein CVT93_06835 [Bacteroidetes bacterium HGW-Bacteroidetes-10]|nr:MAG: hypothetical protein CVT93_06835 [Bacteroidetes bacterium HGW-Bacteroidetes-10]
MNNILKTKIVAGKLRPRIFALVLFAIQFFAFAITGCDIDEDYFTERDAAEISERESGSFPEVEQGSVWQRIMIVGSGLNDGGSGLNDSGSGAGGAVGSNTSLAGFETRWRAGDKIGLFSPQAHTAPGAAAGSLNLPFTAVSSALSSLFSGEMYWGSGLHDFYAYYPYSSDALSSHSALDATVNISLPANQIQNGDNSDHLGGYDFLVASPLTGVAGSYSANAGASLNFRFHHLFSLLVFQFKTIYTQGEIISLKMTSSGAKISMASGTVNIAQPSPAAGVNYLINSDPASSDAGITLTETSGNCRVTSFYSRSAKLYMIILPGDYSAEDFSLEIKIAKDDGTVATGRLNKRGIEILRGALYTVQLNLDQFSW